jgi:hypothetical protein
MDIFRVEKSDIPQLIKFLKEYPKEIRFGTASVLTSLAVKTKQLNEKEISGSMIIRNPGFIKANLQYKKAIPSHNIASQMSEAGSVKKANFSGWKEQETGAESRKKRAATLAARDGNIRNVVKTKYRFKAGNKFYRPQQFAGKDMRSKFQFMMRVLNTRGGGLFLLSEPIQTRRGQLAKGLYGLKDHKIKRLQKLGDLRKPKMNQWMARSVKEIGSGNMSEIWKGFLERHDQIIKNRAPH